MVKEFLSQEGIAFQERRVDEDHEAYDEFVKLDVGMGVPVTLIGDQAVLGFDRRRIETLIHS